MMILNNPLATNAPGSPGVIHSLYGAVHPPFMRWMPYIERYRHGEWRAFIFHDMILDDARRMSGNLTFLDIGCGHGFDGEMRPQQSLAASAERYIGVEPDAAITPGPHVTQLHRCFFEDAPIARGSVNIAFAVMVMEHLPRPQRFWDKLHEVLAPGGVFWGLTVDARHWFCRASLWTQRLRVKDFYLNWLMGQRGSERYENYPVHYRCNTPQQIRHYARAFGSVDFVNFARVGQLKDCFPPSLHRLTAMLDRRTIRRGRPGSLLAVRAVK